MKILEYNSRFGLERWKSERGKWPRPNFVHTAILGFLGQQGKLLIVSTQKQTKQGLAPLKMPRISGSTTWSEQ